MRGVDQKTHQRERLTGWKVSCGRLIEGRSGAVGLNSVGLTGENRYYLGECCVDYYHAQNKGGTAEAKFSFVLYLGWRELFYLRRRRDWMYILKDGRECLIRDLAKEDAPEMLAYLAIIAGESANLTFGPGEQIITLDEEEKFLEAQRLSQRNLMITAIVDGKITACLNFSSSPRERLKHVGSFGVSVLKEYWGLGIGKLLLEEMIDHARAIGVTKINLKVRTDNTRAINLYAKLGFVIEGMERHGMKIDEEYVDFFYMGLIIDEA